MLFQWFIVPILYGKIWLGYQYMKVIRNKNLLHKSYRVKIYVGNKCIGYIKDGETFEQEIESGSHETYFRSFDRRSQPINVTNDDVLEISFRKDILKLFLLVPICIIGGAVLLILFLRLFTDHQIILLLSPILMVIIWTVIYFKKISPNYIIVQKKKT